MAIPEKIYETNGAEETFEVGMRLAKEAKAGDIYCLDGDLGTGKTVFSQGFAAGLGIKEAVNSPTFTIVCEYEEGRLPLNRRAGRDGRNWLRGIFLWTGCVSC